MLCPKCRQELPEGFVFCIHCGANLNAESKPVQGISVQSDASTEAVAAPSKKKLPLKKALIGAGTILLAAILFIVAIPSKTQRNEKAIAEDMKELVWRMKDPSSFQIHGNVYLTYASDGWRGFFVEYSANNSYGGRVTDTAFFWNGKWLGDLGDVDYSLVTDRDEYVAMGVALFSYTTWIESGRPKSKGVIIVRGKNVAKRANVNWVDMPNY